MVYGGSTIYPYKEDQRLFVTKFFLSNYDDSKIILIKKEKITNSSNDVIKKETLLMNNDGITKTFDKHFPETLVTLHTFEWSSNN